MKSSNLYELISRNLVGSTDIEFLEKMSVEPPYEKIFVFIQLIVDVHPSCSRSLLTTYRKYTKTVPLHVFRKTQWIRDSPPKIFSRFKGLKISNQCLNFRAKFEEILHILSFLLYKKFLGYWKIALIVSNCLAMEGLLS